MKWIKKGLCIIGIIICVIVLLCLIADVANKYLIDNKQFMSYISAIVAINAIITLWEKLFPPHNENKEIKVLHEDLLILHNDVDNLRKVIARQNQNATPNKNRSKKKR